jgi:hypothetical protein
MSERGPFQIALHKLIGDFESMSSEDCAIALEAEARKLRMAANHETIRQAASLATPLPSFDLEAVDREIERLRSKGNR